MILKQLRLRRVLSQEQLAEMSGLSVRTIQRIEGGHSASLESLKCLAAVLEVDVSTLKQEKFTMAQRPVDPWKNAPLLLKSLFALNFFSLRLPRSAALRVEVLCHIVGFAFCLLGLVSEPALVGGLLLLANAYLFRWLMSQGDAYGVWYDRSDPA